jgi:ABC-type Zn2+ transport system substrate-binding protein/surface adhesin
MCRGPSLAEFGGKPYYIFHSQLDPFEVAYDGLEK